MKLSLETKVTRPRKKQQYSRSPLQRGQHSYYHSIKQKVTAVSSENTALIILGAKKMISNVNQIRHNRVA